MNPPHSDEPKRARALRYRSYLHVAALFGVIAVVMLAAAYWRRSLLERDIRRELQRIRAAGEPVTPSDLVTMYRASEGDEEAAGVWEQALVALAGVENDPAAMDLPFFRFVPEPPPLSERWQQRDAAEAFLNKYSKEMEQLYQAVASGTDVRFGVTLNQAKNADWAFWSERRTALRLLQLDATVRVHQGDVSAASKSILAILALSRTFEPEPSQVSFLMRPAMDETGREQFRWLFSAGMVGDEDLHRVQAELRQINYRRGLHRAVLAERVSDWVYYDDPKRIDVVRQMFNTLGRMLAPGLKAIGREAPRGPTQIDAYLWKTWRWDDARNNLTLARELVAASRQPWPKALHDAQRVVTRAQRTRSPFYLVSRMNHRSADGPFESALRNTALNRATDAAIAVELYRRRYGKLPGRLEQLVPEFLPEVPIDPFDAKSLRFVVSDSDYVIYSIGADARDDGGQENRRRGYPDITLRVPLVDRSLVRR